MYIGSHSAFRLETPSTYLTRLAEDRSDLLSEAKRLAAAAKNPDTGKRALVEIAEAELSQDRPDDAVQTLLAVPDSPPLTFGGATEDFSRRLYQYETRHSRDWVRESAGKCLETARAAAIGTPEPELKVDAYCAIGLAGRDVGDSASAKAWLKAADDIALPRDTWYNKICRESMESHLRAAALLERRYDMVAYCFYPTVRRASLPLAVAIFLASRGWSAEPVQNGTVKRTTGDLVQAALEKELTGDNSQRAALLLRAVEESPKEPAAHWQLGEVRVRGKWQTVSQAEQAARLDKVLAEYARRRDAAGMSVEDQTALARWCRRNQLDEQQRVHWRLALQAQPGNAEAIQALGLRWYGGMMATAAEIDRFHEQIGRVSKAAERWRPRVAAWLRA